MISGTTVTVELRVRDARDSYGNDVEAYAAAQAVDNVLIVPGACAELDASRPEGVRVAFTLHFPKGYASSLEGCDVVLPAPWSCTCHVVGNPTPYIDVDTPTPWHMPVEVEVAHG